MRDQHGASGIRMTEDEVRQAKKKGHLGCSQPNGEWWRWCIKEGTRDMAALGLLEPGHGGSAARWMNALGYGEQCSEECNMQSEWALTPLG